MSWAASTQPRSLSAVRTLLGRSLLAASLLALTLSACTLTDGDPPAGGPTETSSDPSDAATGGEHLRFGVLGDVATLDPYSPKASDLTFALVRPVYPSLYRFEPDGSATPYLADSLEVSGDGAVVTLADMSWSHGGNVSARDVVASWRRAGAASGFSDITSARATGPQEVTFKGSVADWEKALATNAFVLPKGKVGRSYAGPYMIEKRKPGLSIRYGVNPTWSGPEQGFPRVTVFSVDTTGTLLSLLESGELDAAWFPSTVNLAERLEAADLRYDSALGWSSIRMTAGSDLSPGSVGTLAAALDRRSLQEAFIRDDGRISDSLTPQPDRSNEGPSEPSVRGRPFPFVLAAPHGDELLGFLQDAIQIQLAKSGFEVELIDIPVKEIYSRRFESLSLLRAEGSPGEEAPNSAYESSIPMFHVKSYVVWNKNVAPIQINPTSDGPLWNLEAWSGTSSEAGS